MAAVGLALLVGLAWPAVRLIASRATRRAFPSLALRLLAGLVAWSAAVAAVALVLPWLLLPLGAGAGLVLAGERIRALPSFGRRRRLPPGSLTLAPTAPYRDDRFYSRQAARHGPVFKTSQFGRPVVCVVGLRRSRDLLQRYDDVLLAPPLPFDRLIPGSFLRYMPPSKHSQYRRVLGGGVTGSVVDAVSARLDDSIRGSLESLARASPCRPRSALDRLVFDAFVRLFYGVDPASEDARRLRELHGSVRITNTGPGRRAETNVAAICSLVRRIHGEPSFVNGVPIDDETVLRNLVFAFQTGAGDLAGLLHWILALLGGEPVWRARLRDGDADLPRRVVLETLRLEQSEYLYRRTLAPIEVDGFAVPRGWLIRVCVRESHRDAAVFPDPDRFDPDRFRGRPPPRDRYAPFGASRVSCLGDRLTLAVAESFVRELSRGYEWSVTAARREFNGWHWTPGRLEVSLEPR